MIAYHAIVFLFIAVVDAQDFELFLSPTGDDFANGTLSDPILSLQEALNRAPAGERYDVAFLCSSLTLFAALPSRCCLDCMTNRSSRNFAFGC